MKFGELKGKEINNLKILDEYKRDNRIYCTVLCTCGKIFDTRRDFILSGKTKSCGHVTQRFKNKDISDERFGRLVAIKPTGTVTKKGAEWLCICDCGNEKITNISALTSGDCKSCGCLHSENGKKSSSIMKEKIKDMFKDGTSLMTIKDKKMLKNNTSGYRGVSWDKERQLWVAQIRFKGKAYKLGRFENIEDAIKARKEAEEKFFKPALEEFENDKRQDTPNRRAKPPTLLH